MEDDIDRHKVSQQRRQRFLHEQPDRRSGNAAGQRKEAGLHEIYADHLAGGGTEASQHRH